MGLNLFSVSLRYVIKDLVHALAGHLSSCNTPSHFIVHWIKNPLKAADEKKSTTMFILEEELQQRFFACQLLLQNGC